MALQPGEYVANGFVFDADGRLVLVNAVAVGAENKSGGKLIDADGRWLMKAGS